MAAGCGTLEGLAHRKSGILGVAAGPRDQELLLACWWMGLALSQLALRTRCPKAHARLLMGGIGSAMAGCKGYGCPGAGVCQLEGRPVSQSLWSQQPGVLSLTSSHWYWCQVLGPLVGRTMSSGRLAKISRRIWSPFFSNYHFLPGSRSLWYFVCTL